jgi:hyperosmotically inducible periplasmic protein
MKWLHVVTVVVVLTLPIVGCRSLTGRSVGTQIDDKVITTNVKSKLSMEKFRSLFSTGVGTHFGVVHLSGNVATPEQRQEAERIASRVPGVKRVDNDIVVVPRDQHTASASPSPAAATAPLALTGEVMAIDHASGDVTMKTDAGEVVLRLPSSTIRDLEQGQRLSINGGVR